MARKKRFLVGTSGWNYDHWKGTFYPDDLPRSRWLGHYTSRFPTVEVNYTFYHWPRPATLERWRDGAPRGFTYTLKVPRTITHVRKLRNAGDKVAEFYRLTDILGAAMGCCLFQLPPSLHKETSFDALREFLGLLDPGRENVVEFRHRSWWDREVFDLLREHGAAFCSVSGLDMPEEAVATAGFAYARFHGRRYDTCYTSAELAEWAGRLRRLPCGRVYAYFNNDAGGYAVRNAGELMAALGCPGRGRRIAGAWDQ